MRLFSITRLLLLIPHFAAFPAKFAVGEDVESAEYNENDDYVENDDYAGIAEYADNAEYVDNPEYTEHDEEHYDPESYYADHDHELEHDDDYGDDAFYEHEFFEHCAYNDVEKIAEILAENPEMVNEYSQAGETCLMLTSAAPEPNVEVIDFLIEKGADVNLVAEGEQNKGLTALGFHVFSAHDIIVKALVEHGADVNAIFESLDDSGEKITSLDIVEFVLEQELFHEEHEHEEMEEEAERLREQLSRMNQYLIDNGGRKYEGSMEL